MGNVNERYRVIQFTFLDTSPDPWVVTYFEDLKELKKYADTMKKEFPLDLFVYQIKRDGRFRTFGWNTR